MFTSILPSLIQRFCTRRRNSNIKSKMDKHKLMKQNELRRLMKAKSSNVEVEKINSPIAKYDSKNNLSCVICKLPVKPTAWKVHVNSKQHKNNVEKLQDGLKKDPDGLKSQIFNHTSTKQTASITKSQQIAQRYENTSLKESSTINQAEPVISNSKQIETSDPTEQDASAIKNENTLPENFFDPKPQSKSDAKDSVQEEWEKFQKEIKEESMASNAIIAGEHEIATVDRQIEEIDEQIYLWSKVVNLEDKKKQLNFEHTKKSINIHQTDSSSDDDESGNFEEFSNWRCKKFNI